MRVLFCRNWSNEHRGDDTLLLNVISIRLIVPGQLQQQREKNANSGWGKNGRLRSVLRQLEDRLFPLQSQFYRTGQRQP